MGTNLINIALSILMTALVSGLIVLLEHFFPWEKVFGKKRLSPVANYVIGVLAFSVPFTVLLVFWQAGNIAVSPIAAVIALWANIVIAGVSVMWAYGLEEKYETKMRAAEAEQREAALKTAVMETKSDEPA